MAQAPLGYRETCLKNDGQQAQEQAIKDRQGKDNDKDNDDDENPYMFDESD
jgi:hypothetical protein